MMAVDVAGRDTLTRSRVSDGGEACTIRPLREHAVAAACALINDAAAVYRGVIPDECWHDPYMPIEELRAEIGAGVEFWVREEAGVITGVMGMQPVRDVTLIRHAYVRPGCQRRGVGDALLRHLLGLAGSPVLVGTWAAATWAVFFYEKHGFRLVTAEEKERLLRAYWTIPVSQITNSVVLGDARWFVLRG